MVEPSSDGALGMVSEKVPLLEGRIADVLDTDDSDVSYRASEDPEAMGDSDVDGETLDGEFDAESELRLLEEERRMADAYSGLFSSPEKSTEPGVYTRRRKKEMNQVKGTAARVIPFPPSADAWRNRMSRCTVHIPLKGDKNCGTAISTMLGDMETGDNHGELELYADLVNSI